MSAAEALSGLRRSAIVLLSLGEQRAGEVLRRLPPDAARSVRAEMRRLGALRTVPEPTRQAVVDQFCAATQQETLTRLPVPYDPPAPFASFHEASTDELLDGIRDEHPQTIALVLAHLPPEKSGEVLARLDPHKKVEVIKRIAGIEQTSAAVIEQVERGLRQRLRAMIGRTIRTGGVGAVAEILKSADETIEEGILADLDAQAPALAEQVRRVAAIFDDLLHACDEDVRAVIEQLDRDTISLALRTAREELRRKVLWNMVDDEAEQIEAEVLRGAPVQVSEIEAAQHRVVEVVFRLESAGEIELRRTAQGGQGRWR